MLAPIWTISPLLSRYIPDLPLYTAILDQDVLRDRTQSEINATYFTYLKGEALSETQRPNALVFRSPTEEADNAWLEKKLAQRSVLKILGMIYVTEKLATAFQKFDLGAGGVFPTPVLQSDRTTEFKARFSLLGYWNNRETVDRQNTPRCKLVFPDSKEQLYKLPLNLEGRDVFVRPEALNGPDIWFDPAITNVQFVSDPLAKALIALGARKEFELNQCKFFTPSPLQ